MEKEERKSHKILTENRIQTINKRETSFEGLIEQFENGEDGIYNLITNDKNTIFRPHLTITAQDITEIPPLAQLRSSIQYWKQLLSTSSGRATYIIRKTLIDLQRDQYVIKTAYRAPIVFTKLTRSTPPEAILPFSESLDSTGTISWSGASFCDAAFIQLILTNYQQLKQRCEGKFRGDTWYLMLDFDSLLIAALSNNRTYSDICQLKIQNYTNAEIKSILNLTYSPEYISSIWRNKIPKLISQFAIDSYILWYYTNVERGSWKKCNRCGQVKLRHPRFFSINKTSKDGYYSICKECRNRPRKKVLNK